MKTMNDSFISLSGDHGQLFTARTTLRPLSAAKRLSASPRPPSRGKSDTTARKRSSSDGSKLGDWCFLPGEKMAGSEAPTMKPGTYQKFISSSVWQGRFSTKDPDGSFHELGGLLLHNDSLTVEHTVWNVPQWEYWSTLALSLNRERFDKWDLSSLSVTAGMEWHADWCYGMKYGGISKAQSGTLAWFQTHLWWLKVIV